MHLRSRITSTHLLWVAQALLAALFVFSGISKLMAPPGNLTDDFGLPGAFTKFIGACELLGALALVLPGIARTHTGLTPLAAGGFTIIMSGAVIDTIIQDGVVPAIFPLVVGIIAATIFYGRMPRDRTGNVQPRALLRTAWHESGSVAG